MTENVIIACHECARNSNIPLSEARHYNKNHPYICEICKSVDKGITPSSDISLSTRSDDSNVVHHESDIIRPSITAHSPDLSIYKTYQPNPPQPKTLADYEQLASDRVKEQIEHFRHERERVEREYDDEQERVASYGGGGVSIASIIMVLVGVGVALFIGTTIFSQVSNAIDCNHLTNVNMTNACNQVKGTSWVVVGIIPIVMFFVLFAVFRTAN